MRLIDADKLTSQLCEDCGTKFELDSILFCNGSCAIVDLINTIATVDVDEAKETTTNKI